MKKDKKIIGVALPVETAAEMTVRAAQAGVPTDEFLGIVVMAGAYGHSHPDVVEFKNRPKTGVNGPKTQEGPK